MSCFRKLVFAAGLLVSMAGMPAYATTGDVVWATPLGPPGTTVDPLTNVLTFPSAGFSTGQVVEGSFTYGAGKNYLLTVTGVTGGGAGGAGFSFLTLSSDASNLLFNATPTQTFSNLPTFALISSTFSAASAAGNPYTITGIFAPTSGSFTASGLNLTAHVTLMPVPGPIVGSGLPILIFVGIAFLIQRRRRLNQV